MVDRFYSSSSILQPVSFDECARRVFMLTLLIPEGQAGEAWHKTVVLGCRWSARQESAFPLLEYSLRKLELFGHEAVRVAA